MIVKPEKSCFNISSNDLDYYYRASEMDTYLADHDADLLDGFAKAALTGLLSHTARYWSFVDYAKEAYGLADAMLSERARRREAGK
jgi:hypothetical protein